MRENNFLHVVNAHFHVNHQCRAVDYLGRVTANHMQPDDISCVLVDDNFTYPVAFFVFGDISAAVSQRERMNACRQAFLLYALGCLADSRDFWVCVYDGGDRIIIYFVFFWQV